MAVAARIVLDRAAAEDIVQEVFLRAWMRAGDWRRGGGPGRARYATWLARIAVNLAIDGNRRVRPVALDGIADPPDPSLAADERMIERERAARLNRAVMDLPERQRAAIALSYDAGLSNAEAADALGTSVGAVELLLVRARRALRAAVAETEEG
jgi:RNA polymerase sigma-70 factor (ECF subfamily)